MTDALPDAWKPENLPAKEPARNYIGSSDVAAIVAYYRPELAAMAKWKSAADVFARLVFGMDLKHKPSMTRGLTGELPMLETYRENVGPIAEIQPGKVMHPTMPYAGGSADAFGLDRIIEAKTSSVFAMASWGETTFDAPTDLVPPKYAFQCQWLMGLCEMSLCDLIVGFGRDTSDADGNPMFMWQETRVYRLEFNAEMYAGMESMVRRFHVEHIAPKIPPSCEPVESKREYRRQCNLLQTTDMRESPSAQPSAPGEDNERSNAEWSEDRNGDGRA